ncbi:MAG: DNA-formamidopyrimidine glycosylase family protein [Bryobacteraceae bacterium]
MPELPDLAVYIEALEQRILGAKLKSISLASPFLLRTVQPAPGELEGHTVGQLRLVGKRIAIGLDPDYWLVLHLMIAGRLHWQTNYKASKKNLAAFEFSSGTLTLTEAGSKKRASLHLLRGEDQLRAIDPGGIDVLRMKLPDFQAALTRENHTLKRALTDPRLFSGIGNAYSDEILHRAKLSPVALTQKLTVVQVAQLFQAIRKTLEDWIARLRHEAAGQFPEKVTAFRAEMAVHGRYGQPCPRCGTKVQRIRYAENETNYCPACQTGGKLLADRALSRLLREDWPRTMEQLEQLTARKTITSKSVGPTHLDFL